MNKTETLAVIKENANRAARIEAGDNDAIKEQCAIEAAIDEAGTLAQLRTYRITASENQKDADELKQPMQELRVQLTGKSHIAASLAGGFDTTQPVRSFLAGMLEATERELANAEGRAEGSDKPDEGLALQIISLGQRMRGLRETYEDIDAVRQAEIS